jgi:thiol-disulfide isomerase/thioredoxin
MENSLICTKRLFELIKLPYTTTFPREKLLPHPEPESLLSISDTLAEYKVDSLALQIGADKLDQLPLPCIVQLNGDRHPFFSCLSSVDKGGIEYLDIEGRTTLISRDEFIAKWTGVTLLVEKGENSAEPGYQVRRREVLFYRSLLFLLGLVGLVWLVVNLVSYAGNLLDSIGTWSLMALKITGLAIPTILLWTEIDKDNSAITKFCTGGKSVDCNSVLDSFSFGGIVSLSNLAFAYFFSSIFLLVFTSFSQGSMQLLSYLSYSSLLIVPISLFYQGVKIKKWCMLCLWISGILLLEFATSQFLLVDLDPPALKYLSIFSFLFLASVLAWLTLKPYLIAKEDLQGVKSKLAKFMANREVFDYFLSSSRKILTKPAGLGIFLKGQSSKFHVLKVCNPYCGPCARTHPILEQLYEAGNIDLQILFLTGGYDQTQIQTVSHLMAIASNGQTEYTRQALDDWYIPEKKEYDAFAAKYPMNGELAQQKTMIKAMQDWAEKEQITHTPTIFINGYELPSAYAVEDLKYVLQ